MWIVLVAQLCLSTNSASCTFTKLTLEKELAGAIALSADFTQYAERTKTGKGNNDYGVSIKEVVTDKIVKVLDWDKDWRHAYGASFSNDGKKIAFMSDGGQSAKVFDLTTGEMKLNIRHPSLESVVFAPDSRRIASTGGPGASNPNETFWTWDINTRKKVVTQAPTKPTCLAFSSNGNLVALAHGNYSSKKPYLTIWQLASNKPVSVLYRKDNEDVRSLSFSPNSKLLALGMRDGTVTVIDVEKTTVIYTYDDLQDDIFSVAFHPKGELLAATGKDKTIRLWNLKTKKLISTTKLPNLDYYLQLQFSKDGSKLATYTTSGTNIKIWKVEIYD